ncbi:MAG: LytTR family DNA-binding domain-containing protein [Dysgonamonadaceae bacterium]|jgi:DNA-binding LytR/AlgR family response regulator|nr:LytTR family DNA-binding domain-containing protein [Dysgonamonadaceae bacterium]
MKCIVIDDEPPALKLLMHYCSRVPSLQLLDACSDPMEGIAKIRALDPDLIFLDIHMPEVSGIDLARTVGKGRLVIFTTAHREYAVEGFDLDVVDYLLKPFGFERFLKACGKAEERFLSSKKPSAASSPDGKTLSFKYHYQNVQLPLHAILYIEALNNRIRIVTPDKSYMPVMTMKTIRERLPENDFLRVHRSFIVSLCKITSFSSEQVLAGREKIPVGRRYRKDFLEKMGAVKGYGTSPA